MRCVASVNVNEGEKAKAQAGEVVRRRVAPAPAAWANPHVGMGFVPPEALGMGQAVSAAEVEGEQLHTNYRPFNCDGCGKMFARMDALNRHVRLEGGAECQRTLEANGRMPDFASGVMPGEHAHALGVGGPPCGQGGGGGGGGRARSYSPVDYRRGSCLDGALSGSRRSRQGIMRMRRIRRGRGMMRGRNNRSSKQENVFYWKYTDST
ncbi:hypothetical protein C8F04DRAFT_1290827 [Mycena alexandri]|uniref:C2H2-type domain-containing protein n=1 Tax=Mycena alexandri TaxID=1745969 RepID=A0AAD6WX82_9AGAR|nr:hypothetical protein C8F04DRAFT_1290827 [Mycena alexandri]